METRQNMQCNHRRCSDSPKSAELEKKWHCAKEVPTCKLEISKKNIVFIVFSLKKKNV